MARSRDLFFLSFPPPPYSFLRSNTTQGAAAPFKGTDFMSLNRRHPWTLFLVFTSVISILFWTFYLRPFQPRLLPVIAKESFGGTWDFTRDARNLLMNDSQCSKAFPDLFQEIDRAVNARRHNHVTRKELDDAPQPNGYTRAMIYDQQLYILGIGEDVIRTRDYATLQALHRAIVTSPEVLPNIEFSLMVDDKPNRHATWAFSRKKEDEMIWLMPDFGYWSWPEPKVGSYSEVQTKAFTIDKKIPWERKINKLVWRGAMMDLEVREQLLEFSAGKEWSDVKILDWGTENEGESHLRLTMDQHCKYKYVAHTEGVSYSARLEYLQNCRSVVVSHKLKWIQHHHHLMKSSGIDQNFVEVAPDFSNLELVMDKLLASDQEAERIAANNVKTFREHYLTPAAETCYWRKLIRGWASVSFEPEYFNASSVEEERRGIPVESYLLMRAMDWMS